MFLNCLNWWRRSLKVFRYLPVCPSLSYACDYITTKSDTRRDSGRSSFTKYQTEHFMLWLSIVIMFELVDQRGIQLNTLINYLWSLRYLMLLYLLYIIISLPSEASSKVDASGRPLPIHHYFLHVFSLHKLWSERVWIHR